MKNIKIFILCFASVCIMLMTFFFISDICYASPSEEPSPTPSVEPTLDPELYPIPTFKLDDYDENDDLYNPLSNQVVPWMTYITTTDDPNLSFYEASGGMRNPPNNVRMQWRMYKYIYDPTLYTPNPKRYVNTSGSLLTSKPSFSTYTYSGNYATLTQFTGATSGNTQFQLQPYTQTYYIEAKCTYSQSQNFTDGKDVRYWVQLPDLDIQYPNSAYHPSVYFTLTLSVEFQEDFTTKTVFAQVTQQELMYGIYIDCPCDGRNVLTSYFLLTIYCDGVNNLLTVEPDSGTRSVVDPPDIGGDVYIQTSSSVRLSEMLIEASLPNTVSNLINLVKGFFVPNEAEFQTFLGGIYNDMSEDTAAGGLAYAKYIYTELLTMVSNHGRVDPPVIHIPALNLALDGARYQYFNGYDFDFSTVPDNIWTYSRMVGDIFLVGGFISLMWTWFSRFYNTHFAKQKNGD